MGHDHSVRAGDGAEAGWSFAAGGVGEGHELAVGEPSARAEHRLRQAAAFAYYLSPTVRDLLGVPADGGDAVRPDLYPEYVVEGLLDHVVSGG